MNNKVKLIGLLLLIAGVIALASCEKAMNAAPGDAVATPKTASKIKAKTSPISAVGKIDPRADRILREMGDYLKTAKEFAFHAVVTYDEVHSNGQKIQYGGVSKVSVRRPDRIYAKFDGDERRSRTFYNGKTVTIHDAVMNLYAVTKVPPTIDGAVDLILDKYGFQVPIADFVYEDPYTILRENVQSGVMLGLHDVNGVPCRHLAFRQEAIDWQIWIADGPKPVPMKLVITYKHETGSPQYAAVLSDWDFQPRLSDHAFTFYPPTGAGMIEFLSTQQEEIEE